jgi:hypothetical protein
MKRSWFPLSETHSRNEAHSLSLKHIHSLPLSETKLLHGLKLILEVQTKRIEAHSRQVLILLLFMFNVMNFKDINNFRINDINIQLCNSINVFDFMPMTVRD